MKLHIVHILFVVLCFQSCGVKNPQFTGTAFEKYSSLEGTGFSKRRLDSLTVYLENNLETTAMIILHDGKTVFEYGNTKDVSYIASCRKSVVSILYGKYVDNGVIDLSQDIGSMGVDEDKGLLSIEKTALVNDIITSRSGVFYEPANKGYDEKNMLERGSVKPGNILFTTIGTLTLPDIFSNRNQAIQFMMNLKSNWQFPLVSRIGISRIKKRNMIKGNPDFQLITYIFQHEIWQKSDN